MFKYINIEAARIIKAASYSAQGLKAAWSEAAFRTECFIGLFLFPLACLLPLPPLLKALLLQSMVLVLFAELINIALEEAVNYISTKKHPLAKKIKDVASAAVLLSLLNSLAMWIWALLAL